MNEYKIMIVEDNPDDIALIERALKKNNFRCLLVIKRNGEEALDYLFRECLIPDLPHLVILDLKLPKIDGLEFLKTVRDSETTGILPVVVLTSSIEQKDLIESYRLGANSYIRKPVNFDEFIEIMNLVITYWLRLNIYPPINTNKI